MTSPTARTLSLLRKQNYYADVVEKWIPHIKIRKDALGAIDILATDGTCILAVQSTSFSNRSARVKKILALPQMLAWVKAGGRLQVHGWRKRGRFWDAETIELGEGDFGKEDQ